MNELILVTFFWCRIFTILHPKDLGEDIFITEYYLTSLLKKLKIKFKIIFRDNPI